MRASSRGEFGVDFRRTSLLYSVFDLYLYICVYVLVSYSRPRSRCLLSEGGGGCYLDSRDEGPPGNGKPSRIYERALIVRTRSATVISILCSAVPV